MRNFADRVYGEVIVDDPCAEAIIVSPAFDRLWRVNQYGPLSLADPRWSTSRAEHCIGVYHLLGVLGATREERIAGLVHDTNHFAFSHMVDWLMGDSATQEKHPGFVAENPHTTLLKRIINAHGLDGSAVLDAKHHTLLEQPAPAMCADRMDYTMRDGMAAEQTTAAFCHEVVEGLCTHQGRMTLANEETAERFSHLSVMLHVTREGLWQNSVYAVFREMLRGLLRKGTIVPNDFLVDDVHVLAKIRAAEEPRTVRTLAWIADGAPIEPCVAERADFRTQAKIRFIDPHVLRGNDAVHVSTLRPGLARFLRDYALLRKGLLYTRLPDDYRDLAPTV